jgi:hypothetical protein
LSRSRGRKRENDYEDGTKTFRSHVIQDTLLFELKNTKSVLELDFGSERRG